MVVDGRIERLIEAGRATRGIRPPRVPCPIEFADEFARALGHLHSRQSVACTLRFGDVRPMPYRQIAEAMGISHPAAIKLVKKGTARLRANGFDVTRLAQQATAA